MIEGRWWGYLKRYSYRLIVLEYRKFLFDRAQKAIDEGVVIGNKRNSYFLLTASILPYSVFTSAGNFCCVKPGCQICPPHYPTRRWQNSEWWIWSKAPLSLSCDFDDVINIFYCALCIKGNYVDETSTQSGLNVIITTNLVLIILQDSPFRTVQSS